MFVTDRVVGYSLQYFVNHTKGGYVGHHQYMSNTMTKDVIIMGSSRANHHYNPLIIEDSLHMSCYNCGQDGMGIVFNYGQWLLISERYSPKLIIYDVTPDFDCLKGDNHKFLGWLKLYYERKGIKDFFSSIDKKENIKMLSRIYRYNYNPLQIVADYIHPIYQVDSTGFSPLEGDINKMQIREEKLEKPYYEYDTLKLSLLEEFIRQQNETKVVFVVSPVWYEMDKRFYEPIVDICKHNNCLFIDFSQDPKYVHNNEYFKDGMHLNKLGADEFTLDLLKYLK